jgi:hypothetical protein
MFTFRIRITAIGVLSVLLAACAPTLRGTGPTPIATQQSAAALQSVLVSSQLLVGRQRLAIGVLDANTPINDAQVRVRVYRGSPTDPLANVADATFKGDGLEGRGIYVAYVSFAAPGAWVAEIAARKANGPTSVSTVPLKVTTTGSVPSPGQPAPRSHNQTRSDVADLSEIDSGVPPDDMHDLSIADAVAQQRPALVVFATPAFCTSAMCGPEVYAVQRLEPAYRTRVAFIHVEIYRDYKPDPSKMRVTPTVTEWHLQTDPWVFLIDAAGIVHYSFEGPTATDELESALDVMLASH